ncbi:MAG: hypothetical protein H5U40_09860, partial [Polyangiaceae bacterium]|nr:hypothetical protein [Polyangiaceae bacterium]
TGYMQCGYLGTSARRWNLTLAPGTYYLVADTDLGQRLGGDFTFTIDFESEPTGATCNDPIPLALTDTWSTVAGASTTLQRPDDTGCATVGPATVGRYYAVHVDEPSDLALAVDGATSSIALIRMDVRGRTCAVEPPSALDAPVPPGDYCVGVFTAAVDDTYELGGRLALRSAAAGFGCDDAIPIPAPGVHHIEGTLVGTYDVLRPWCSGVGRDRLYAIELTERSTVTIASDATVALYGEVCDGQIPLDCTTADIVRTLDPGRYHVLVTDFYLADFVLDVSIDCDSDGDSVCDASDGCPADGAKTAPGACGCGVSDADTDGDGTLDCNDGCPSDPSKTAAGVCGCGISDADTDADGTFDCVDGCPTDPAKTTAGACGCGVSDADTDADGTLDCNDGCPSDPAKTAAGVCGCGVSDADTDADGTLDCVDGCPTDPAKTAAGVCGCG